jgi:hypothetical protein
MTRRKVLGKSLGLLAGLMAVGVAADAEACLFGRIFRGGHGNGCSHRIWRGCGYRSDPCCGQVQSISAGDVAPAPAPAPAPKPAPMPLSPSPSDAPVPRPAPAP